MKAADVAERVLAFWRSCGVPLAPPASTTEIERFEILHALSIPDALRHLLSAANGLECDAKDDEGFRFMGIEEYESMPNHSLSRGQPGLSDTAFVFVDYLDWSWGYAVEMSGEHRGSVYMVGTADGVPSLVSRSVEHFLQLYLDDDPQLYGEPLLNPDEE